MTETQTTLTFRHIPGLKLSNVSGRTAIEPPELSETKWLTLSNSATIRRRNCGNVFNFACISLVEKSEDREFFPSTAQLLKHPLALLALVPKDAALFAAGAVAGAAAKTVTAPLDRIKLLMQVAFIFPLFRPWFSTELFLVSSFPFLSSLFLSLLCLMVTAFDLHAQYSY